MMYESKYIIENYTHKVEEKSSGEKKLERGHLTSSSGDKSVRGARAANRSSRGQENFTTRNAPQAIFEEGYWDDQVCRR